mmetsp:Transcript_9797/g.24187  ORF Transcript_9797/g.24187 Transcript_9797/m.24187 type:complete len:375 (+) Transcript_9797:560-1684(+)|eukprot:CAMPEP_0178992992 /NCGR_PEP_ID=MMETSP0795-20121207/6436_1 /TAXON_ID=88552 /ORGANISM="Amoebophrya sp., Strain Ameob2" /LENGTH=374 /DNA_ID=CAMNT_0020684963 /DNA_START=543 /DNA_END=1667 /DNA_ORIENTATION=+
MVTVREDTSIPQRPTLTFEPANGEKHTATLFFFHGLGDTANGWREPLEKFAREVKGLKIIAPTAPLIQVTLSGGARQTAWCDLEAKSLSPMDLMQMVNNRPPLVENGWVEVLKLVNAELREHPHVPLSSMLFGGFSLGAHIAAWTALQLPSRCAGIVLMTGILIGLPHMWIRSPVPHILHCHGTQDMVIPFIGAQMIAQQMKETGITYELKTYEMAHAACDEELRDVVDYLRKCLAGAPPSGEMGVGGGDGELTICSNGVQFPNGTSVEIHSLKSKPHMNGKIGVITGYLPKKGRYSVLIEDESLALSPSNFLLELQPDVTRKGTIVRLQNLKAAAPWNGAVGRVGDFQETSGRYCVDLGNKMQLNVKPENFAR